MNGEKDPWKDPPLGRIRLHDDRPPLQRVTYSWTFPLIRTSRKQLLSPDDLGPTPTWLETNISTTRFMYFWRRAKQEGRSWIWIIFNFFHRDICKNACVSMAGDLLFWSQAPILDLFVKGLGRYQAGGGYPVVNLYVLAFGLFLVFIARLFCISYCGGKTFDMSYITRAAIMGGIYRKSLSFASGPRQKYFGGKGINVITSDTNKVCSVIQLMNYTWLIPIRVIVGFGFAYWYLGIYSIPAMLFILCIILALYWVAKALKTLRTTLASTTDARLGLTQESLQNIKVVKYLAMEGFAEKKIHSERAKELKLTFQVNTLLAVAMAIDFWSPIFAATISIATMAYYSPNLDAGAVFAFMQTFSGLTVPLWMLPGLVGGFITAKVASKRIDLILQSEETVDVQPQECIESNHVIITEHAQFQWDAPPPDPQKKKRKRKVRLASVIPEQPKQLFSLYDVNLMIPKGALVAIVGKTGSGKTSLISGLMGEMRLKLGTRKVLGTVGLCQQNVWLTDGTVRDNILFGLDYEEHRYQTVIQQCTLDHDLSNFPYGDKTLIGEKGATVSGGQRQRIGLARVAYAKPDVAYLDDPLSAVDANVGRSLFYGCIKHGLLKDSTRILTTHHTGFLSQCDLIILMQAGRIIAMGTYGELSQSDSPRVRELLSKKSVNAGEMDLNKPNPPLPSNLSNTSLEPVKYKEDVAKNASKQAVRTYIALFGGMTAVLSLSFFAIATEVLKVAREYFLKLRFKEKVADGNLIFSIKYAGIGAAQGLLSAFVSILAVWLCKSASKRIHNQCLERVLSARLSVFDTTPIGRILNRFGRDLDSLDSNFPDRITQLLVCLSALISSILLIGFYYPMLLITMVIPLMVTWWIQGYFRRAWRQIQQISGITLGPIVSFYSESLSGLSTIRAFRKENFFIKNFDKLNDRYCYSAIWLMSVRRWASLRTETLWIIYLLSLIILCIVNDVPAEVTGLIVIYVMHTVESVDWSMRQLAELESCFVSVERLYQYVMNLETESEDLETFLPSSDGLQLENWPFEGSVSFENVTVQYKPSAPPVLNSFNFNINPKQKVAIVGRSGAGKSTIIAALFRFVNITEGKIVVDGVDISKVPFKVLRQKLAMVPQDPVLFTGSLRTNLDPEGKLSDESIWNALESVRMKDAVSENPQKLDLLIDDTGSGFSLGQRQLLCLARAILKNSKLLILDEATSNLDRETEALMQESLDQILKGMTVITIAHRLETILEYDVVIVMGKGKIIEYGNPKDLAEIDSEFAKMLKAANIDCQKVPKQ